MKGEISEEQAFLEFLTSFQDNQLSGYISRGEWNDYYGSVSASVNNDDHFIHLIRTTWSLN